MTWTMVTAEALGDSIFESMKLIIGNPGAGGQPLLCRPPEPGGSRLPMIG